MLLDIHCSCTVIVYIFSYRHFFFDWFDLFHNFCWQLWGSWMVRAIYTWYDMMWYYWYTTIRKITIILLITTDYVFINLHSLIIYFILLCLFDYLFDRLFIDFLHCGYEWMVAEQQGWLCIRQSIPTRFRSASGRLLWPLWVLFRVLLSHGAWCQFLCVCDRLVVLFDWFCDVYSSG